MRCEKCGGKTKVTNTRSDGQVRYRIRVCLDCGYEQASAEIWMSDARYQLNRVYLERYGSGAERAKRKELNG